MTAESHPTAPKKSSSGTEGSDPADGFDFDHQHKVIQLFTSNAKTYIQLSSAALILCSRFLHDVLGIGKAEPEAAPDLLLICTWLAFLLTILAGAFYQYLGAKYLEIHVKECGFHLWDRLAKKCGWVYGIMLGCFYGGAALFFVLAWIRLKSRQF